MDNNATRFDPVLGLGNVSTLLSGSTPGAVGLTASGGLTVDASGQVTFPGSLRFPR
jgi:hypothetical protein